MDLIVTTLRDSMLSDQSVTPLGSMAAPEYGRSVGKLSNYTTSLAVQL